jgi:hypothetical protein
MITGRGPGRIAIHSASISISVAMSVSARRRASGRITARSVVSASRSSAARSVSPRTSHSRATVSIAATASACGQLDYADRRTVGKASAAHSLPAVLVVHLRDIDFSGSRSRSADPAPYSQLLRCLVERQANGVPAARSEAWRTPGG